MRVFRLMFVAAAAFALFLTTAAGALAKPAPPGPGNSPSAKACQKGGYQNLVTSTGQMFASQDACVSYAAHGGVLRPRQLTFQQICENAGGTFQYVGGPEFLYCFTPGGLPFDVATVAALNAACNSLDDSAHQYNLYFVSEGPSGGAYDCDDA